MQDLSGLTVVSVEQAVAAPYASWRLAEAGARVIKVERPAGDFARRYDDYVKGQSAYYVWLNRGKESVRIDLDDDEDRALLDALVSRADIFIQNLKPGALAKKGFASAALRQRFPRLITCDITGFGTSGPNARLKAYDLIVQAEVGLCAITGSADEPARVGVSVADINAGTTAYCAILEALLGRERSGVGRAIDVSLFDSIADWMNVPLLQYLHGGHEVARSGVAHPTIAPYGAFRCAGGEQLIISVQNDAEWVRFAADFLGTPAIASDPRFATNMDRIANRTALDAVVADAFRSMRLDGAVARLERAGIAYGRLNDIAEAARHPHLRFAEVDTPAGRVQVVAPAAIHDGQPARAGRVAALGEHDAAVRAEFMAGAGTQGI